MGYENEQAYENARRALEDGFRTFKLRISSRDRQRDIRHARKVAAYIRIAPGEHVPIRAMFKNFMEADAMHFVRAGCTCVPGVSESLPVSPLAKKFNLPVVPHVGDMGQIHQHGVLLNHIAVGHPMVFLEHIPRLRSYFVNPIRVENGVYCTPQDAGCSCDLVEIQGEGVEQPA
ncbi:MAG TPA: enolase C-terminal domain-like protein [Terriglobia bacterium]|nr:enolase C-terminal domain-like protein [Terriglobia bacterium]